MHKSFSEFLHCFKLPMKLGSSKEAMGNKLKAGTSWGLSSNEIIVALVKKGYLLTSKEFKRENSEFYHWLCHKLFVSVFFFFDHQ